MVVGKNVLYRWTLYVDDKGNLVCVGAVKDISKLEVSQFYTWILDPVTKVDTEYGAPEPFQLANITTRWGFGGWPSGLVETAWKPGQIFFKANMRDYSSK